MGNRYLAARQNRGALILAHTFRHPEILRIARERGRVTVDGLAERLGVTVQTIRRDLGDLARAGHLDRVHGGAILPERTDAIGYAERRALAAEAKAVIAALCAAEIADGATLFLDIGTTCEAVARALMARGGLTVATNNINVATILAGHPDCEVVVTGGVLRRSDGGLVGGLAGSVTDHMEIGVAVIGCSGIGEEGDMLEFDEREVRATRAIMEHAGAVWLACDAGKLGRRAPVRLGALSEVDALYTDAPLPGPLAALCARGGTRVVHPGARPIP